MTDIEMAARELNDADRQLGAAMSIYATQGWSKEDFETRLEDLMDEYEIKWV